MVLGHSRDRVFQQPARLAVLTLTTSSNFVGSIGEALIAIAPQHLAGHWVHKMHPRACRAGHRLIDLTLVRSRIVSEPALHIRSRRWAAVDQRGYNLLYRH